MDRFYQPPHVSIIIPAHNAERFLDEAVTSAILEAEANDGEIIIVDHASEDTTAQLIHRLMGRSWRVRSVTAPAGGGPARAKNVGLAIAKAPMVTFLDADDMMVPVSVAARVRYLAAHPDKDAVFGRILGLIDPVSKPYRDAVFDGWLRRAYMINRLHGQIEASGIVRGELPGYFTLMYRRSLLDRVGLFDESLDRAEDFDLAYRCALHGPIAFVDVPTVAYRVHSDNMSIKIDGGLVVARPETSAAHSRALQKHGLV